jgi:hypothetical protein
MNDIESMLETNETRAAAPAASASRGAYVGLVVLIVVFVSVFWFRARR